MLKVSDGDLAIPGIARLVNVSMAILYRWIAMAIVSTDNAWPASIGCFARSVGRMRYDHHAISKWQRGDHLRTWTLWPIALFSMWQDAS